MNKTTRTELVIIADRSGSMEAIKKDTQKALNDFIAEQKKLPGECFVSLYQFDDFYESVFESKPLAQVGDIEIHPRGGTALLDALGKTINTLEERLLKSTDENTPDTVICIVLSDGEENSSKEYTGPAIKKIIEEKTNAQGWKFIYFGTNQDAISTAAKYGFNAGSAIAFAGTARGLVGASVTMSNAVNSYRSGKDYMFTASDRALAAGNDSTIDDILKTMGSTTIANPPSKKDNKDVWASLEDKAQ